jgi:hypothetical protein
MKRDDPTILAINKTICDLYHSIHLYYRKIDVAAEIKVKRLKERDELEKR